MTAHSPFLPEWRIDLEYLTFLCKSLGTKQRKQKPTEQNAACRPASYEQSRRRTVTTLTALTHIQT